MILQIANNLICFQAEVFLKILNIRFLIHFLKGNQKKGFHCKIQRQIKKSFKSLFEINIYIKFFMFATSKIEKKEKNDFRVKFAGNQGPKHITPSREMILTVRQRTLKELPSKDSQVTERRETEEESNLSLACVVSRQDLDAHFDPAKQLDGCMPNSSTIVSDFDIISSFFEDQVTFKLIFRASSHNFSVKEFHEACDAYDDTLTLCLTEDNKIIGGFTPLNWEDQFHKNSTHFKTDFKRESFLFSVTDKTKYPLVKALKNKAICCFKSYGPTFGGGYDLLIGDRCNEFPNATSYFPRNFEHPNGDNYNKRDFTGTSRKNFKLQQWEVFQVIKANSFKSVETANFTQPDTHRQGQNQISVWEKVRKIALQIIGTLCSDS